jgi:hypothetical protein
MAVTACQSDFINVVPVDETVKETASVITMVTGSADGVISLSMDAPAQARFGVWIDLDGDGARAGDGTEDVTLFNAYQDYTLSGRVSTVSIHGDITYLGVASNELMAIDISGNPFLTTLNVPMNRITAIDLSSNPALKRLDISENDIALLDVSSNLALESLWVFNNKLSSLDVSNNINLTFLDCSGNELSNLDISDNIRLTCLLAYNNRLSSLDASRNLNLNRLWLFGNSFSDDETSRLTAILKEVVKGDMWISNGALDNE